MKLLLSLLTALVIGSPLAAQQIDDSCDIEGACVLTLRIDSVGPLRRFIAFNNYQTSTPEDTSAKLVGVMLFYENDHLQFWTEQNVTVQADSNVFHPVADHYAKITQEGSIVEAVYWAIPLAQFTTWAHAQSLTITVNQVTWSVDVTTQHQLRLLDSGIQTKHIGSTPTPQPSE